MRCHYAAVWFDLDGTLLNTVGDLALAINASLQAQGYATASHETIARRINDGARGMFASALDIDINDARVDALMAIFPQYYERSLSANSPYYDGMEAIIARLEAAQTPWGVVTNKIERYAVPIIAQKGLSQRVAALVCGDTTQSSKPSPEPLLYACHQANIAPERCIFIGDSHKDIDAGRAAGMVTVAAAYGYLDMGVNVADWGADHIIQQPTELMNILWTNHD